MKTEPGIPDYQNLSYDEQRKLDQKAYSAYVDSCSLDDEYLTFNSWFGTEYHQKYINVFLRKYKLEKIKKDNQ